MANLDRWFPFKFRRQSAEQKKTQEQQPQRAAGAIAPIWGTPLSRMMESFLSEPFGRDPIARFGELDRWFGDFSPAVFRPNIDVVDEESHVKITAELPGMEKDDIKLSIDDGSLSIRGEKKNVEESREAGCYRTERSYGYFQRSIPLPRDVDQENAEASFDKGVLSIRFPKTGKKEETGRRIEIKG